MLDKLKRMRKRDEPKRTRGEDGKLYTRKKVRDAGHRAHENRTQTATRRARWKGRRALSAVMLSIVFAFEMIIRGLLFALVHVPIAAIKVVCRFTTATGSRLGGWLGMSRSDNRGGRRR